MENKLNQTKRSPNELDQYPNARYNIIQNIDVVFLKIIFQNII